MKRMWKRIISLMMVFLMLQSVIPAQAASTKLDVPSELTMTLYSSKKDVQWYGGSLNKQYLVYSPNSIKNMKSSNSKVVKISKSGTSVYLTAKKAGTATVSFKTGGRTYKIKVTVVKYQNPVSSVAIGSTTIAGSKFDKAATTNVKYSKFANKKVKVMFTLAEGWSVKESEHTNVKSNGDVSVSTGAYLEYARKGWAKSDSFKNGKKVSVKGGAGFFIICTAVNDSTGQEETITINFK
ncbi:MAG: hypothetical protein LUI13_04820 [Lachnospiraceae bacterium]|nr:hypothetical protein [Lachnospiraceae bacterium]